MRSHGSSFKFTNPGGNAGPPSATYSDMAGMVGSLRGSGLIVCQAAIDLVLGGAPTYIVYWRWLIDGVAPDTTDQHTNLTQYASTVGVWRQKTVQASKKVGSGVHFVVLQWKMDAPGAAVTYSSFTATAALL